MSISSSMNAGVAGLNANANKLATISDNIANSQTMGYKRADTDFASMTIANNVRSYTAGGVRTNIVRDVESKGAFVGTQNATDIAIAGRGMLPVTSFANVRAGELDFPLMLVPTGSFQPDANGILRTPSGLVLLGWPADIDGTVPEPPRDTAAALRPVVINRASVAAEPTTQVTLSANLPASATQADAVHPRVFPITVEYFDNLGASRELAFSFSTVEDPGNPGRPLANTWSLTIADPDAPPVAPGDPEPDPLAQFTITFSDNNQTGGSINGITQTFPVDGFGNPDPEIYSADTGNITLELAGDQFIDVRIGRPTGAAPQFLSQLASIFSPVGVTKDGSPAGTYAGVTIDENGLLSINYSSGFSRVLYKIPVADVPNMNGLKPLDNQAFALTAASGSVYFWDAGTGPAGAFLGFAQEQSTTDIAQELTDLIRTQRAYSSNAKIIQTVDEMLQETTNLKR